MSPLNDARFEIGTTAAIMVCPPVMIPEPPIPAIMRATMSVFDWPACAATIEPMRNITSMMIKRSLRRNSLKSLPTRGDMAQLDKLMLDLTTRIPLG